MLYSKRKFNINALVGMGVRITAVSPKRRSLEDAFLEITAGYTPAPKPTSTEPPPYVPEGAAKPADENPNGGGTDA